MDRAIREVPHKAEREFEMLHYYHGTNNGANIVNAITGNGTLRTGFHLTPDINVARNYGRDVVVITLEADLTKAHIGTINKDGNYNGNVGNGTEVVLKTPAAINEFYYNVVDAVVTH